MKIVGVYKIVSPSGKVYIGQSIDINRRFRVYISAGCNGQPALFNSFKKYGRLNHLFEILHELPEDVDKSILDNYETFYISCFRDAGFKCLNIRDGGSHGKQSEKTKALISAAHRTPERLEAASRNLSKRMIGNQNGRCNKGRPCSDEKREKLRKHFTGTKHSLYTKELVSRKSKEIWNNRTAKEAELIKEKSLGNASYKSKMVLNTETGEVFNSAKGAAIFYGLNIGSASFIATSKKSQLQYIPGEFSSRKWGDQIVSSPVEIRAKK